MNKEKIFFVLISFIPTFLFSAREVITQSGTYVIGLDLVHNPSMANDNIITIGANDVVLDLNGHTIEQGSGNTQPGLKGIEVQANCENVTIENGIIENLTGTGIVINQNCNNIILQNLFISNCQSRGVAFTGASSQTIKNIVLDNVNIFNCARSTIISDSALFMQFCTALLVNNCRISENGNSNRNISVIRLRNISAARFLNLRVFSNFGSLNVFPLHLSNVSDSSFTTCFVRGNNAVSNAGGALCIGFEFGALESNNTNIFQDCVVFANTCTVNTGQIVGFRIERDNQDNVFLNCRALNNLSAGNATGFLSASNSRTLFLNCFAQRQSSTNASALARGFFLDQCTGNKIIQALSSEQLSMGASGRGIGIDVNNNTESIVQGSFLLRNAGNGTSNSFGIRNTSGTDNIFERNVAQRNGSTSSNQLNGLPVNSVNTVNNGNINNVKDPWTNLGLT